MKFFVVIFVALVSITAVGRAQTDTTKAIEKQEILKIDWPSEYNWKVGTNETSGKMHLIEVIPGTETVDNWSIIGSLLAMNGTTNVPMEMVLNGAIEQQKKTDTVAKLTVLDRNDTAAAPWILFKVESPTLHGTPAKPESDIFFVMQGKSALFNAIVGVHEPSLSDDFVNKWKTVFHSSRLSIE